MPMSRPTPPSATSPAALLLASALVGCEGPGPRGPLPDALVAVVRMQRSDRPVSLVVELGRPGSGPVVRAVGGALALGPRWAREVRVDPPAEAGAPWVLHLADPAPGGEEREVLLEARPELVGIEERGVWVRTGGAPRWVGFPAAAPAPDAEPRQGGSRDRLGPGTGFHVRDEGGDLALRLPRAEEDRWIPVMHGVEAILGTWWLTTADLPDWEHALLHARFKRLDLVAATRGRAEVDGHLGEWRASRAVPVDTAESVLEGIEAWSGPRDASFGVAARRDGDRVFVAVRLRDDHLLPGQDALTLTFADRSWTIPVPAPEDRGPRDVDGARVAFSEPMDHGIVMEAELPFAGAPPGQLVLPLVVGFHDRDPGEPGTRLASAADPWLVEIGYVAAGTSAGTDTGGEAGAPGPEL